MTGPPPTKSALRGELRGRLAAVSAEDAASWSAAICGRLEGWEPNKAARTIMLFAAAPGEPDLGAFAAACVAAGKRVCLPRIDWTARRMVPAAVTDLGGCLTVQRHGIREPGPGCGDVPIEDLEAVLVPGLGFDASGARLGRGGGFYDRFLASPGLAAAVAGVGFEVQLVPAIPVEAHDVRLGAIVTERRVITPK